MNIWTDSWLPREGSHRPIRPVRDDQGAVPHQVSELIDATTNMGSTEAGRVLHSD